MTTMGSLVLSPGIGSLTPPAGLTWAELVSEPEKVELVVRTRRGAGATTDSRPRLVTVQVALPAARLTTQSGALTATTAAAGDHVSTTVTVMGAVGPALVTVMA